VRGDDGSISRDSDAVSADHESTDRDEWPSLLAQSLDRLIRSSRSATEATLGPLAERFAVRWRERPDVWMEITATGVSLNGEHYLEQRQWVLAAFMAGVRRVRPTAHLGELDCLRLASELAVLRATASSVESFRDWLWSDGAEGFEIEVRDSFSEVLDTVLAEHRLAQRTQALQDVPDAGDSVQIAIQELDEATIAEEFEAPLAAYVETMQRSQADQVSEEQLELAGQRFEDPSGWAAAEFEAAMTVPALRDAIPPPRLARQLISRISETTDSRLLRYVANLLASEDAFARQVAAHLADLGLGTALAHGTGIARYEIRDALVRFMQRATPQIASEIAAGLLDRASADPTVSEAVADVIHRYDTARFIDLVDTAAMERLDGKVLLDTLLLDGVPQGLQRRVLLSMPPDVAASWLDQQTDELFWSLEGPVRQMLMSESTRAVDRVVEILRSRRVTHAAKLLAEVLDSTGGDAWSRRALRSATRMMARAGLGERYLMRWINTQSTPLRLRVEAIHAAAERPSLRKVLIKRRFTEFMDPNEIRDAIKEVRQRAKESSWISPAPDSEQGTGDDEPEAEEDRSG